MNLCLDSIRPCLEGAAPSLLATCDADGIPNITYVSQVYYVDREHVALTFQFFNKTRENILANPNATALVLNPETSARYRLALMYRETQTEGPLFEAMKARLAGIASHTGMAGVFQLRGSDIYRVLDIEHVAGIEAPAGEKACNPVASQRQVIERLQRCQDLDTLLEQALEGLSAHFGIDHAMLLFHDAPCRKLYTVASRGYPQSGVGSEFPLGRGIIGTAAEFRTPIRIMHMASEYAYGQAIRDHLADAGMSNLLETAIPFPGLPEPHSQLSVPIIACDRLLGVLHVESGHPHRFSYDDEDMLVGIASMLGAAMLSLQNGADAQGGDEAPAPADGGHASGTPLLVRHYGENDSIFLGDDYLIKGVAGAIFWRLLQVRQNERRSEFSNRELRLDPTLRLPDIDDNLEARLILLRRRLAERAAGVGIEKIARGRFRLCVDRPLLLQDMAAR